jgi:hypothetical protein
MNIPSIMLKHRIDIFVKNVSKPLSRRDVLLVHHFPLYHFDSLHATLSTPISMDYETSSVVVVLLGNDEEL